MKEKRSYLFIILIWIVIGSIYVIYSQENIIKNIFGILMVLFFPGYITTMVFFPKKRDLEIIGRLTLSLGLSIVVVSILGLLMNYTIGIGSISVLLSILIYSILLIILASYKRDKLDDNDIFSIDISEIISHIELYIKPKNMADGILTIILVVTIIFTMGVMYFAISTPKIGERFTEFYILNKSGKAEYETDLRLNVNNTYILGITNQERVTVNYTVQTIFDKDILNSQKVSLGHDETWQQHMTFVPNKKGEYLKLEFLLFREDYEEPYRNLFISMNVTE